MEKTSLNLSLIKRKIGEIRQAIKELRALISVGKEEFLLDSNMIDASKYKLIVAIEASIAICNHIVARLGGRTPESYSDCFIILSEANILSKRLAEKLANMAKFRNLLVHIYWQVDNEKIYEFINKDLKDLEYFLSELKDYIGEKL